MNEGLIRIIIVFQFVGFTSEAFTQGFEYKTVFASPEEEPSNSNGVALADYDGDGILDMYVVSVDPYQSDDPSTWSRLLKGQPFGFIDVTEQAGLSIQPGGTPGKIENGFKTGVSWGDYDNDGDPDLLLTHFEDDLLWQNKGDGTFVNVSETAGISGCKGCYSTTSLWWDADHDGFLDLYISDWLVKNRYYHNQGDGTFLEKGEEVGLADDRFSFTALPFDINRDGWVDLYITNDGHDNSLYVNNGDGTFELRTSEYGLGDSGNGMGIDICDYNRDGNFDIYLTNIWRVKSNPFFEGSYSGIFTEKSKQLRFGDVGWGWGIRFFDYDHDMDEDIYIVNQHDIGDSFPDFNRFYVQNAGNTFESSEHSLGVDQHAEARGLEVFDFNSDGDMDMVVTNWEGSPVLYENKLDNNRNWIQVQLEGTDSNRNGFGTVIRIKSGDIYQHRLYSGANFLGQSVKPLHFGLGLNQSVDEITIFWPNGKIEKAFDIEVNQKINFKEGELPEFPTETYGTEEEQVITALEDQREGLITLVYPNPLNSSAPLTIEFSKPGDAHISIFSLGGQKLYDQRTMDSNNIRLEWPKNADRLRTGIYLLIIQMGNEKEVRKVYYSGG